jgi:hypothetical protein
MDWTSRLFGTRPREHHGVRKAFPLPARLLHELSGQPLDDLIWEHRPSEFDTFGVDEVAVVAPRLTEWNQRALAGSSSVCHEWWWEIAVRLTPGLDDNSELLDVLRRGLWDPSRVRELEPVLMTHDFPQSKRDFPWEQVPARYASRALTTLGLERSVESRFRCGAVSHTVSAQLMLEQFIAPTDSLLPWATWQDSLLPFTVQLSNAIKYPLAWMADRQVLLEELAAVMPCDNGGVRRDAQLLFVAENEPRREYSLVPLTGRGAFRDAWLRATGGCCGDKHRLR